MNDSDRVKGKNDDRVDDIDTYNDNDKLIMIIIMILIMIMIMIMI